MRWITVALALLGLFAKFANGDDGRITKNIPEEREKGYIVANMARIFSLRYSERVGRNFKLLSQNLVTKNPNSETEEVKLLHLDTDTGVITTTKVLDREELCGKAQKCIIRVQAVMLPNEFFTMLNMDVIIDDINDNAPMFAEKNIELNIKEGEHAVDDVISLDRYKATDEDIERNGEIYYELNNNPYVAVETRKDERGNKHLQLRVLAVLDYEETSSLELTLTATDGGVEPLSDRANLDIVIADANDHDPEFQRQEYFAMLRENEEESHVVTNVHAEDKDSGSYGAVRYFIPKPTPGDTSSLLAWELLSIDEMTGEVTLKTKVDREAHDGLRALIEARDSDPDKPRVGKTWLRIQVEDVNDNAPVIKVNFIVDSDNMTAYIPESASIKTYVAYVRATDVDNGPNGKVTTEVTAFGKHKSNKELVPREGQFFITSDALLATGMALDREEYQYFIVKIKACDEGSPSKCTVQNITVVVLDINDNSPVFDSPAKAVMIAEDSEVGSYVINVNAKDKDSKFLPSIWKNEDGKLEESRNGIIRYSIVEGDRTVFEIDEVSGDIHLKKALDHEERKEWRLVVEARDGGWQTYSSANCSIVIRVGDINDNQPVFISPTKDNKEVYATILKEQVVITIEAMDSDSDENSRISYKIVEQDGHPIKANTSASLFILNPNTGDLRLNFSRGNLTHHLGLHSLTIEAKDSGEPPMSARTSLHVTIIDEDLPDPVNVAGFDEDYILLAAALAAASLVIAIIIILIVLCRRKKDRQLRTYNCRSAERKSQAWISAPVNLEGGSFYQTKTMNSTSSASPKKYDYSTRRGDAVLDVDKKDTVVDHNGMSTFKAETKVLPTSVVFSSVRAMDRDSGRGDSDSENGNEAGTPDVLQRLDERSPQYQGSNKDDESIRTSELGPQCSEHCRTQGHSDTCWMPSPVSDNYYPSIRPKPGALKYGMTASAPRLDTHSYSDYERVAPRTNDYPTLQHLPSTSMYATQPEYYRTMSPGFPEQYYYHHGYEGELAPIEEMAPLNDPVNYMDPTTYDADDISAQTRLTLSTSPQNGEGDSSSHLRAPSRASLASARDYPHASWQHGRPSWDTRFSNPPRVQRSPMHTNYVEFAQDYKPSTSPIPRVTYPRMSSSSSVQSARLEHQNHGPYDAQNYDNLQYYHQSNDRTPQNPRSLSIQQAQDIVNDVDHLLRT